MSGRTTKTVHERSTVATVFEQAVMAFRARVRQHGWDADDLDIEGVRMSPRFEAEFRESGYRPPFGGSECIGGGNSLSSPADASRLARA